MPPQTFVAIVPIKPPAIGKSRLAQVSDEVRRALATAFALDTVSACLSASSVGAVLVVTDDAAVAAQCTALGCSAIPDGVTGELNASLRQAAAEAQRRWPGLRPAAVCADLPALTAADLDTALALAPTERPGFVADADGVGTSLYTAPYDQFDPRFGSASRAAHRDSGADEIEAALPHLRRDVDTLAALFEAELLGLGPHTRAVLPDLPRT